MGFYVDYSFLDFSVMPWRSAYPVRIRVRAPSPVTLHAVPKLSCRAKMVSIRAVPVSLNNRIPVISPREAITVPPGTPGAPMAKMPSSTQNRIMVPSDGIEPYRIWDTVITKNTSVRTDPHRCTFANSGMPKSTISFLNTEDFLAQRRATARVAAEDMVPTAVI